MNLIGHHEVARKLSDRTDNYDYYLGSLIPDFIGMWRLHKTFDLISNPELRAGIRLHQKTDTVFDDLALVRLLKRQMINSFKEFMTKWPAVKCGYIGIDILFDNNFIKDESAVEAYDRTMKEAASGQIYLGNVASPPEYLQEFLIRFASYGLPRYDDSEIVARIIYRRLEITGKCFDYLLVPQLATAIEAFQAPVLDIGQLVMHETLEQLATGNSYLY